MKLFPDLKSKTGNLLDFVNNLQLYIIKLPNISHFGSCCARTLED